MVLTTQYFSALLQVLSLTQGRYKPAPGYAGYADATFASSGGSLGEVSDLGSIQSTQPVWQANDTLDNSADTCTPPYYQALPVEEQAFPPFDQAKATVYRYRQQQSVNLASWYV